MSGEGLRGGSAGAAADGFDIEGGLALSTIAEEALCLEAMLVARSYLYAMFHTAFGGAPSIELVEVMGSRCSLEAVDEYAEDGKSMLLLRNYLENLPDFARDADFMRNAEAEYARHFVGPNPLIAYPWASPYLSHEMSLFQESTLAVRRAYAERGFVPKKLRQVPDDHVSLLCDLMLHLAIEAIDMFRQATVQADGGAKKGIKTSANECASDAFAALADSLRYQARFAHEHLNSWLDGFARASCTVRAAGKSTVFLYPQLAKAVAEFVRLDEEFLLEAFVWIGEVGRDLPATALQADVRDERFFPVERARDALGALRLVGIDENELEPMAQKRR